MIKRTNTGLTAIELLIVLAILGMLLFTAVPQWLKGDRVTLAPNVEAFGSSVASISTRIHAQAGDATKQLNGVALQGAHAAPSGLGIGAALNDLDEDWVVFDSMGEGIIAWRPTQVPVSRQWSLADPERSSANTNRGCFAYYYLPADGLQPIIGTVVTDC